MRAQIRTAFLMLLVLTVLTGVVYPLAVTGIARLVFPSQSGGSLITRGGRVLGSRLIGQEFRSPAYFWSRPSATGAVPYDGLASGGSNLGPSNPALSAAVRARIAALRDADPNAGREVPADLATASASGLDPHISPASAEYQLARVARARALAPERVRELVRRHTHGRDLGFLGEPVVDVLELNLALDAATGAPRESLARHAGS